MSSLWLKDHRANVTSQNGEDGVIAKIFERIGEHHKWACEFGAADGIEFSNTGALIRNGWAAVLIESRNDKYVLLQKYASENPKVIPICIAVRPFLPNVLDVVLGRTPIPIDFDFLSIDVDGEDFAIWESIIDYKPRVVMIEVDSSIPPGTRKEDEISGSLGCSIEAVVQLGKSKGYELALHTGNAIFVRREYAFVLDIDPDNWQELFDRSWIRA